MRKAPNGHESRSLLILKAAETLFFDHGYERVSVDDIGAAAGVTGPAIYRYYKGKTDILDALLDQVFSELLLTTSKTSADPSDEVLKLAREFFVFSRSNRRLVSLYAREYRHLDLRQQRLHFRRQCRYMEVWERSLASCYPTSTRNQRLVATRAAHSVLMSEALYGPINSDARDIEEFVISIALNGLSALLEPTGA